MELNEMIRRKDAIGYEYDEIAELVGVDEAVVKQLFEGDAEAVPKELRLKIESVFNVSPKNGGGFGASFSYPAYPSAPVKNSGSEAVKSVQEETTSKKNASKQKPSMKFEELKRRKYELGYTNEMIAEKSGVPLSTIQKIFAGFTLNPRYETRLAIEAVLNENPDKVRETAAPYNTGSGSGKKRGEYTLEDYYDMPEDRRVELIDGVIYDMTAPAPVHQGIAMDIAKLLQDHVRKNKGECIVFGAPVDVHIIEEDDKTIVQPDVLVVCDRNKVTNHGIEGAPDLVVEVMSLSTKKKDMTIKLDKYIEAGVREYWLVDPQKKKVITYLSEEGELVDDLDVKLYGFEDQIPVMIFENQCTVDMKIIYEDNRFLFDLMERDAKK